MSLPPSPSNLAIVDSTGRPTPAFMRVLQTLTTTASDDMPTPSPVSINADYTGTILTNSLPAKCTLTRTSNGKDVSLQCQWSMEVLSGTITATVAAGIVTITALGSSAASLQVKSTRNHVDLYAYVTVNKVIGATPSGGGTGSTTATVTTFNTISSASYGSPITTSTLTVTVGSSGIVNLTAPLGVATSPAPPSGAYAVYGKWQWYNGTSWVDVAPEVAASPAPFVFGDRFDGWDESDGTLTVNTSQSGLTPGSSAQFQLLARNGSATRVMSFYGTASAVAQ